MIYLDSAATTKPKQRVIDAMMPYFNIKWQNPSALYSRAKNIKDDINNARKTVANYINADASEIYFTSSGSESNCWAIQGFMNKYKEVSCVITSNIEHKSITDCVNNMSNHYFVGVDSDGFINIKELEETLEHCKFRYDNILVSIQFANNEIGTIQHIKEIAKLVHKYNGVFHTDAVQAFGHIPIDVQELDIDMMTASGHKIGTPKGVGFLYKKSSIEINPLIYGSQMDGMRGGTENVPYIIGMAKAVDLVRRDTEYQLRMTILRNNFITQLKALGCSINGSTKERLPNNISITFSQNVTGEAIVYGLDTSDIYIGTGSACNSSSIKASHVLKAIGLSDEDAYKTIRITLDDNVTMDEIDETVQEISKLIQLLTTEVTL